jgi:hypothetical protein
VSRSWRQSNAPQVYQGTTKSQRQPSSVLNSGARLVGMRKGPALLQSSSEGGYMANLKGLESVVSQLREERTNLVNQLRHVDAALSVLVKLEGGRAYTKPRRRRLSASARRRIAAAQRARWARVKGQSKSARKGPADVTSIRTMSAAARRKIAAAQRKRWAKLKQQKRRQGNNRATRL